MECQKEELCCNLTILKAYCAYSSHTHDLCAFLDIAISQRYFSSDISIIINSLNGVSMTALVLSIIAISVFVISVFYLYIALLSWILFWKV